MIKVMAAEVVAVTVVDIMFDKNSNNPSYPWK